MNARDAQTCGKILAEIAFIREMMCGLSLDAFLLDERTARATCMTLINIGELVKSITPELREAHPEIPWRAIAGMRDATAHKYQTLRKEDVYNTCAEDIPSLGEQLQRLLADG